MFGRHFHVEHMDEWDVDNLFQGGELDLFWKVVGEPGFHDRVLPYAGAIEGVAALSDIADIYIVTSPLHGATTWTFEREGWLKKHFGIEKKRIIHTSAKHMFAGDWLIDDKPANVLDYVSADPKSRQGVLWSQPWNATAPTVYAEGEFCSKNVTYFRTRDWASVMRRMITGV
jgi:hypothetical protein